jgi:hypothetical protein
VLREFTIERREKVRPVEQKNSKDQHPSSREDPNFKSPTGFMGVVGEF